MVAGCAASPALARPPQDLAAVLDLAMARRSTSVLVGRAGDVLAERYAPEWGPDRPREVASVAKSIVAVLVAMAVEDGAFTSLDQAAADFIPEWRDDARAAITLRHLMSMTSGLDDTGLALRGIEGDQFAINAAAPLRHPPGTRWAYNTAAYHLLFHVLARAVGQGVEGYAGTRLFAPLAMADTSWVVSRGSGEQGPVTNYYSALSTARDLARFGALVLGAGSWNGHRLISAGMLQTLLSASQALNPAYGLLWWSNARPGPDAFGRGDGLRFPSAPRDTVAALGAGGQMLLVVPSRNLIVVRQGDGLQKIYVGREWFCSAAVHPGDCPSRPCRRPDGPRRSVPRNLFLPSASRHRAASARNAVKRTLFQRPGRGANKAFGFTDQIPGPGSGIPGDRREA